MRIRGLIQEKNSLVLIYRVNKGRNYYVFPGGGVENDESELECLSREGREELGVQLNIYKLLYSYYRKDGSKETFYHCTIAKGELGSGKGPEYTHDDYKDSGSYAIEKIPIKKIANLALFPTEIRDAFVEDMEKYGSLKKIPYRELKEV